MRRMANHLLFTYGTLQQVDVQMAVFGRALDGEPDAVVKHRLGEVVIDDPYVIKVSGSVVHPALIADATPGAEVPGTVLTLTVDQLARADAYEVDAYRRVVVPLRSGRMAWVYALA